MKQVYPFNVPAVEMILAQRTGAPRDSFRVTTADIVVKDKSDENAKQEHTPPSFEFEGDGHAARTEERVGERTEEARDVESQQDL